jgi:AcrR family transcriptional regulator
MKRSRGRRTEESDSSAEPGVPAADAGGARAAILQAAAHLLRERGLTATRPRDVTALAGVSTGLLNHYFTWNVLRATALAQVLTEGLEALLPAAAVLDPDPRTILDTLVEAVFAEEADPLWRLWVEAVEAAPTDPAMADALSRASAAYVDRIAACLERGVKLQLWRCPDPAATAFRLSALHDGLVGMLLTGLPRLTRAGAITHMRTAFLLECPGVG